MKKIASGEDLLIWQRSPWQKQWTDLHEPFQIDIRSTRANITLNTPAEKKGKSMPRERTAFPKTHLVQLTDYNHVPWRIHLQCWIKSITIQTARKDQKMKGKNFIYLLHFITRKVNRFLHNLSPITVKISSNSRKVHWIEETFFNASLPQNIEIKWESRLGESRSVGRHSWSVLHRSTTVCGHSRDMGPWIARAAW